MFAFFTILLILDGLILATVVLLQAGQGGGLAALGGGASTDTFFGGRHATTILTKVSWWCGGIFLTLSLILSGISTRGGAARSVLEEQFNVNPTPVTAPIPLEAAPDPAATAQDSSD